MNIIIQRYRDRAASEEEVDDFKNTLDHDRDGRIDLFELTAALDYVAIRPEILHQRISLELKMTHMVMKLPLFLVCLMCFLIALLTISPSGNIAKVHEHLVSHFGMDSESLQELHSFELIYGFIEEFELKNEELQATSASYWCEKRYSSDQPTWDDHLMLPVFSCPSPRLHSLGHHGVPWGASAGSTSGSSSGSTAGSSAGSSSHRRLGGSSSSSSSSSTECVDDDHELQLEENDPTMTCNNSASHVCRLDLGILLCPVTCGYCPPFEYNHKKKFDKPQVTMLPVVVHQTRFAKAECHGFAHTYEMQPFNPMLKILPALDGQRNGRVLSCIDRNEHSTEQYAHMIKCPANSSLVFCNADGYMPFTKLHHYHGDPIYPIMIVESHKDVGAMKKLGWMDMQTEEVTVSTVVYTEGMEIFTSIAIHFSVDDAGNIDVSRSMVSYHDVIGGQRVTFVVCLCVTMVGALCGLSISLFQMAKDPSNCDWGFQCFEMVSRAFLFGYCLTLLIQFYQQPLMSEEYDHLLHSLLDAPLTTIEDREAILTRYYEVKTEIYEESQWLLRNRIVAYLVCFFQFMQLVIYFDTHPRMGVLTATITEGLGGILNFMALFLFLFCFLGFLAHWMFGGQIFTEFGTYETSLTSQVEMLYGMYLQPDGAAMLTPSYKWIYWTYSLTFLLVVFYFLLNFFLAIVVDAFVAVKAAAEKNVTEKDFISDVVDVPLRKLHYMRKSWPRPAMILRLLDEAGFVSRDPSHGGFFDCLEHAEEPEMPKPSKKDKPVYEHWAPEQLLKALSGYINEDELPAFIYYYYMKVPELLAKRGDFEGKVRQSRCPNLGETKAVELSPPSEGKDNYEPNNPTPAFGATRSNASSIDWESALRELCPLPSIQRPDAEGENGDQATADQPGDLDLDLEGQALLLARKIINEVRKEYQVYAPAHKAAVEREYGNQSPAAEIKKSVGKGSGFLSGLEETSSRVRGSPEMSDTPKSVDSSVAHKEKQNTPYGIRTQELARRKSPSGKKIAFFHEEFLELQGQVSSLATSVRTQARVANQREDDNPKPIEGQSPSALPPLDEDQAALEQRLQRIETQMKEHKEAKSNNDQLVGVMLEERVNRVEQKATRIEAMLSTMEQESPSSSAPDAGI